MISGANRAGIVEQSVVREVFEKTARLERGGARIVHLEIGRPDFDTPSHIKEAAKQALDDGHVHYTSNYGLPELRAAIADKLAAEKGLHVSPDDEVIVTVGATEAIHLVVSSLLDPGDEMLVPEPSWPNYRNTALWVGAVPVSVPLREEQGFELQADDVVARLTPRTKLLAIVSPANPTGSVISQKNLLALAEVAREHNLAVLADEIYERIVYDVPHVSIASLPGMADRTITINGFSKIYAMTGWRLGYMAGPRALLAPIVKMREYVTSCPNTFAQYGAVAALRGPQEPAAAMVAEFRRRRDRLVAGLNEIPALSCPVPHGAFYAFPNVRRFGLSSAAIADFLLERAHVAVVPGSAFGPAGEGYLRLSYASSYDSLVEAVERMKEAFAELPIRR
ncbi:MAG: pyridoxal phosphate-dependent aminotransferase [Chloroflexota bacterium]